MKSIRKITLSLLVLMSITVLSCKKEGCTDSTATNYNSKAKKDNGTCLYPTKTDPDDPIDPVDPTDPINPKDSTDKENVITETFASLDAFRKANAIPFETFSFDASVGGNFNTTKGMIIKVSPNSLVDYSGNAAVGNIVVRIKEIYSKWDIITSEVYTESYGIPLESGGEFFIDAKANGAPLKVAPGKSLAISMPAQSTTAGMQLLTGGQSADTTARWTPVDSTDTTSRFNYPPPSPPSLYEIKLGILGWINIDRYLHNGQTVTCEFEVTNLPKLDPRNTRFVGIVKGVHSVYQGGAQYSEAGGKARITANRIIPSLPSLHLVYTISDSKLYFVLLEDAPNPNALNSIFMKQITSSDLNEIINDLK